MAVIRILLLALAGIFSWSYFLTGAFEFTQKVQNLEAREKGPAWTSDLQQYVQKAMRNLQGDKRAMIVYGVLILIFSWVLWKTIRFGLIGVVLMLVLIGTYPSIAKQLEPVPKEQNRGYLELTGSDQTMYAGEEYPLLGFSIFWTFLFLGSAWFATRPPRTSI